MRSRVPGAAGGQYLCTLCSHAYLYLRRATAEMGQGVSTTAAGLAQLEAAKEAKEAMRAYQLLWCVPAVPLSATCL